jgi:hypothetical protein
MYGYKLVLLPTLLTPSAILHLLTLRWMAKIGISVTIILPTFELRMRDSIVGIATGCVLDDRGVGV